MSAQREDEERGPGPVFFVLTTKDGESTEYGLDIDTAERLAADLMRQAKHHKKLARVRASLLKGARS